MIAEGADMRDRGWAEILLWLMAGFLVWLQGVLPFIGWGLFGGLIRGALRPPQQASFGGWLRLGVLAVAGGLCGALFVPLFIWFDLADTEGGEKLWRGMLALVCGFGGVELFGWVEKAWQNPKRLFSWFRHGPGGGT